jgi:hypothetical protein
MLHPMSHSPFLLFYRHGRTTLKWNDHVNPLFSKINYNLPQEILRGPFEKFVDSPYSELELCGGAVDGLVYEVPPLASDALLTTLHPLLENVLQTVCHKLQEDSGTGGFDLAAPFPWLEKPRNSKGQDLDCMADVLMGFYRSRWAHPLPLLIAQR